MTTIYGVYTPLDVVYPESKCKFVKLNIFGTLTPPKLVNIP